jgi:hypothetical protein
VLCFAFIHSSLIREGVNIEKKQRMGTNNARQAGHAAQRGPGALQVNRAFFQPRYVTLTTRPDRHSAQSSADSTPRCSTGRTFAPGPANLTHRRLSNHHCILANTVRLTKTKKKIIHTVALILNTPQYLHIQIPYCCSHGRLKSLSKLL